MFHKFATCDLWMTLQLIILMTWWYILLEPLVSPGTSPEEVAGQLYADKSSVIEPNIALV